MTVALEKGLEDIKNELIKRGYKVILSENNFQSADAYIFLGSCSGILSGGIGVGAGQNGILMINAANKTANDIDYILKSRLYSPLF